ncbi:4-alpha-glucanotransferase [Gracilinema caldarium]|uniref:4-alpha-glucanotransferase n=1 Tax=Gracilinema caldarium (strain ATCC 51460 / DSM 7334 / H1) TaxID=744872 RepID=F8EYN1_GRAC1|nr:4-alpha-glucanotransferase [Gracilinema caldarium]AEJ18608.1 4-alpha-glucanotransferase [Gracilinema caldarium DSM 7334]
MHRKSGILLHPTSLPGPYGIGDIGKKAFSFIDWLVQSGQKIWQVLPLGPTGYGDSPYASFSTFAGNPLLVSLDTLISEGYLSEQDLSDCPAPLEGNVDYGMIIPWKFSKLYLAAQRFLSSKTSSAHETFNNFKNEESWWLDDYVLFMDIKEHFDKKAIAEGRFGAMWSNYWPKDLALKKAEAIEKWISDPEHQASMEERRVIQFFFFSQWKALKSYANTKGISIIGDIPIFVAADSVDVWAHRHLFQINDDGQPIAVAGVPPDYFSATGQLWGNPLYNWKAHEAEDFSWWIKRIKGNMRLFDYLRVDHFRGFEAYWAIPFGNQTAEYGRWEKAPGHAFFKKLKEELGDIPILAEDLGFITEEVRDLRDSFELPGMKILQFAFDANESGKGLNTLNGFLPHMYTPLSVVYTGTHDNDTMKGWLDKASQKEKEFIINYLGYHPEDMVKALIRLAMASVSEFAVIPMQDVLGLGSEARMNTPSTLGNNWKWRCNDADFSQAHAEFLKSLSYMYGRNIDE